MFAKTVLKRLKIARKMQEITFFVSIITIIFVCAFVCLPGSAHSVDCVFCVNICKKNCGSAVKQTGDFNVKNCGFKVKQNYVAAFASEKRSESGDESNLNKNDGETAEDEPISGETDKTREEAEDELKKALEDFLLELDLTEFEKFFAEYGAIFGKNKSLSQTLYDVACGNIFPDYNSFFSFLISALGVNLKSVAPMLIIVFCIVLLFGIVSSADEAKTSGVLFMVCYCAAAGVLFCALSGVINENSQALIAVSKSADAVFPLLVTLLALTGATAQAGFFKPACAFVGDVAVKISTSALLPLVTASAGISAASSLSNRFSVKKTSELISSAFKWIIGFSLAIFSLWAATAGFAAKSYDGAFIRAFKFAVSGSLPFVGGFASGSVDLVLSGAALIKNAAGGVLLICLFASAASALLKIAAFSLSLKLLSALCEPIADKRMATAVNDMGKSLSMLAATVIFAYINYFILLVSFVAAQSSVLC